MIRLLVVGAGGFVGAISRYAISGWMQRRFAGGFPVGTLAVNVIGCAIIGAMMYAIEDRQLLGAEARVFWTIGVLGAFTTFSTFGYETFDLLREGSFASAGVNVAANVIGGLAAIFAVRAALRAAWG